MLRLDQCHSRKMCYHRFKLIFVFLVGFGIGFTLALLCFAIRGAFNSMYSCKRISPQPYTMNKDALIKWFMPDIISNEQIIIQVWKLSTLSSKVTYSKWLENQKMQLKKIDMDAYLYGPKEKEKTEADWLSSNVHITCAVFVKKVKLAKSIKDSWGKRCNKLYFFGQEKGTEVPVINFEITLLSSWQQLCEAFNYIWKENRSLQWVIFVNDDTLVIPENLRYILGPLNHTEDYYLGHAITMWGQAYNVADAGYVISRGVLGKLIKVFDNSQKCLLGGKYWKQEDYYLAKHLASMGIYPSDTRDQFLRGTFHGYSLQFLLWGIAKTGSYWRQAVYPTKNGCCSFMSVTFNVGETDKMYTLNYLLYYLHVLSRATYFGNKTAVISVPDEDVWKIALKEEFNITNLNNISTDAYYNIWHSKYSEPGRLITKGDQLKKANDST